jgi:probable HAF family extracellular repeat protein
LFGSGGLTDLGTLGGMGSQGLAINAAGLVVGESLITDNTETHAFLFNGSTMVDLGTLGGTYSSAIAINNTGQVAGHSYTSGDLAQEAFRYSGDSLVGLRHTRRPKQQRCRNQYRQ